MEYTVHNTPSNKKVAEVLPSPKLILNAQDGLDLLGNLYYMDFDRIIIHEGSLTPDFFDLKNGMAGEILQKFSNYRVKLAIVGDFLSYPSQSLKDFMNESNRQGHVVFVKTIEEALKSLS